MSTQCFDRISKLKEKVDELKFIVKEDDESESSSSEEVLPGLPEPNEDISMIAVEEDKESEKEEEPVIEQEGSDDGEEALKLPEGAGDAEQERAAEFEVEVESKLQGELTRFMMELKASGKEANDREVEE